MPSLFFRILTCGTNQCCYTACCDVNKDNIVNEDDFKLLGKDAAKLLAQTRETVHKLLGELKTNVVLIRSILTMVKSIEGMSPEAKSGIDEAVRILQIFETAYEGWKEIDAIVAQFKIPTNLNELGEDLNLATGANNRAKALLTNLATLGVQLPVKAKDLDAVGDAINKASAVRNIVEVVVTTPPDTATNDPDHNRALLVT